jgi:hypothetical protein
MASAGLKMGRWIWAATKIWLKKQNLTIHSLLHGVI